MNQSPECDHTALVYTQDIRAYLTTWILHENKREESFHFQLQDFVAASIRTLLDNNRSIKIVLVVVIKRKPRKRKTTTMPASNAKKVLVVGATGATGKHVVQMLLDQGQNVVAVARSEEKMKSLLRQEDYGDKLTVEEVSISELTPQQFQELTKGCDAVVRYVKD